MEVHHKRGQTQLQQMEAQAGTAFKARLTEHPPITVAVVAVLSLRLAMVVQAALVEAEQEALARVAQLSLAPRIRVVERADRTMALEPQAVPVFA